MMPGGLSENGQVNGETVEICNAVRADVEGKANSAFSEYTPVAVRTQVVAGTNFFVKIHVGSGDHVHVRIFRPLPHTNAGPEVHGVQTGKTADDALEYF